MKRVLSPTSISPERTWDTLLLTMYNDPVPDEQERQGLFLVDELVTSHI